jgi:hypothetical protein
MAQNEIIQYFSIFLLSIVKLVLGSVPLAILYIKLNHLSFVTSMVVCCLGGFTGMFIFTTLGEKMWIWLDTFEWYKKYKKNNPSTIKSRRRLIHIKNKYGLWGVSFLSPILLSIPGGCLLASRFYSNKGRIYFRMSVSIIVWVWVSGALLNFVF